MNDLVAGVRLVTYAIAAAILIGATLGIGVRVLLWAAGLGC